MTTVLAIQPAVPRPTPVPIAAARPRVKRSMSGKESLAQLRRATTIGTPMSTVTISESSQARKRRLTGDIKREDSAKRRTTEAQLHPQTTSKLDTIHQLPSPAHSTSAQALTNTLGESLGLQRRKHSRYIGLTTPYDRTLIGLSEFDTRNESNFDLGTFRKVNDNECFIMLSDETSQNYGEDAETLAAIEQVVAPHGNDLIDVYFRIVHPGFPIIQKRLFRERIRNGDRHFSPPLLAGIYLLALNWWTHDPKLAALPKPDVTRLEEIASRALSVAMQRPKLSTLQGGLLFLQRPEADSWSLTTQLVAIGQELGLHLDCSNWSIPGWERGLRKRIAWALYMQDKWCSLIHGRPSHIFGANWAVKPIEDEDFNEKETGSDVDDGTEEDIETSEQGQLLFAQMISLTAIMAEVMDTFYTQVAIQDFANAGKNSIRLILDRAKPVQIRLKEWFAKLPASTRMDSVNSNRLSSTGYLHLAYFATEITLHRRIVQSLDPATSDAYLLYICRSAAKTRLVSAMDFVNRLRPEHLQSFWYFASKVNFTLIGTFGSLLWATAPCQEEANFYKTRLQEYRWTLNVSSKRAEFLKYAVQILDASTAMLSNLPPKPPLAQRQGSKPDGARVQWDMPPSSQESAGGAIPSFSRYNSTSAFSGFSADSLEQYGSDQQPDMASPTPPSSV